MAITKTNFINYSRCPRYVTLDKIKKEKLTCLDSIEEYKKEEQDEMFKDILESMYDEEGNDLIDVPNPHLDTMLPYYNEVEQLAGALAPKYFKGSFKYSKKTYSQESFDFKSNGLCYLCYVDIYNEVDDHFNIIEVKATTTKKFLSLQTKEKGIETSIFKEDNNIYHLLEDLDLKIEDYMPLKKYQTQRAKLFDRYSSVGHYVYDLAVQRYIIENDLKQHHEEDKINKVKYYLAVLNHEYIFDGTYKDNKPVYNTNDNGKDIVCYFDLTNITKEYMYTIEQDHKRIESYLNDLNPSEYPLGIYCENKRTTVCKYKEVCFKHLPHLNSTLAYLDNHHGFATKDGVKYTTYELINDGKYRMLDIPDELLNRDKNVIQKQAVKTNEPYINIKKIKDGLNVITYPIYHLDFETFPCPLPRFKGEKCYQQSVFQFSLHIERKPGVCDKEQDHYGYLANNNLADEREELIKAMIKYIDPKEGTILVYNDTFEKGRLKELANLFPKYKDILLKYREMVFDLLDIVETNNNLYQSLGYSEAEAKLFNYYHPLMSGSFSIKKVLPLFSNLSYKDMEVANGVEAMIAYNSFSSLDKRDKEKVYNDLIEYCKQDTWAMVEILNGLRKM